MKNNNNQERFCSREEEEQHYDDEQQPTGRSSCRPPSTTTTSHSIVTSPRTHKHTNARQSANSYLNCISTTRRMTTWSWVRRRVCRHPLLLLLLLLRL